MEVYFPQFELSYILKFIRSKVVASTISLTVRVLACVIVCSSCGLSAHCEESVTESRRERPWNGDDLWCYWQPRTCNFVAQGLGAR